VRAHDIPASAAGSARRSFAAEGATPIPPGISCQATREQAPAEVSGGPREGFRYATDSVVVPRAGGRLQGPDDAQAEPLEVDVGTPRYCFCRASDYWFATPGPVTAGYCLRTERSSDPGRTTGATRERVMRSRVALYSSRPALACIIGARRVWTVEMISSEEIFSTLRARTRTYLEPRFRILGESFQHGLPSGSELTVQRRSRPRRRRLFVFFVRRFGVTSAFVDGQSAHRR